MKCPLFVMTATRIARSQAPEYIGCIKEECAWWDVTRKACAVEHIAYSLRIVAEELIDIRHTMPKADQFTK